MTLNQAQSNPRFKHGSDLFIVDNSDSDWKARKYLNDWTEIASAFDIATAYFEIGAFLALDGKWQKLDKIRILMGDEVSKRTKETLVAGIRQIGTVLDDSLDREKERNDFLLGVPAIISALKKGQIECRVYTKEKFHAKCYITHAKQAVVGSIALVGSSNFTVPGITDNVELNVQIRREVDILQEWYERHWNEAFDITPEILRIIERHAREYFPFEVYARALQQYFLRHEISVGEWELMGPAKGGSRIYPILDQYQREGYQALINIAERYRGAFLCDGVGLGKTFVGLMVIERLLHQKKRVALFVTKGARDSVWGAAIKRYLPNVGGDFTNLAIFNHTDLLRGGEYQERLERVKELADAIVIDEAHHFRNPSIRSYRRLYELVAGKQLFLLTATPINNRLIDLQHMIELFSQKESDYFKGAPIGIHSLPGHFRTLEKKLATLVPGDKDEVALSTETNQVEADQVLSKDLLFGALVVQRSRAYVKRSQIQQGETGAIFPTRENPKVVPYSLKKTYGRLIDMVENAFSKKKPLLSLAIYYPLAYYKGPDTSIDAMAEGRQQQVVSLIRIQLLKRFESSVKAFEMSCETLFLKLLAFVMKHAETASEKRILDRWVAQHSSLIERNKSHQYEFSGGEPTEEEDVIPQEFLEDVEHFSREEYKVEEILQETYLDLDQLAEFLNVLKEYDTSNDDKVRALVNLLKSDSILKKDKVLIFTEYMATARYLAEQLRQAGITDLNEIDSDFKGDRGEVIERFSPYYNGSSSKEIKSRGLKETRILISTDILSEGLNLQDCARLINYDIHWNPVRLMQRIGRIDRRLSADVERAIISDHPEQREIRKTAVFWNFLPPNELDRLLRLYGRVAHKTLQISKVFGIEGKKLLTPTDDYEALKDFTQTYEGTPSPTEEMHLEYQRLLKEHPELLGVISELPNKVFSGKAHPSPGTKAVFFCYSLPAPALETITEKRDASTGAGYTAWYLFNLSDEQILETAPKILAAIRSTPQTVRQRNIPDQTLSSIREKVERHIKNTYLKRIQAPIGVRPVLKAWMELS